MNRWSVLAALVLTFSAVNASAQVGANGMAAQAFTGMRLAGIYESDTTNRVLRTDVNGRLLVSDEGLTLAVLTGAGINGKSIASGQALQSESAIGVAAYGKFDLLLSWNTAAAADSDSVAIAVKIYGKISSSPGDGLNFLLGKTCDCAADTATLVFPAGVTALPRKVPPTFLVLSPMKVAAGPNISLKIDGTSRLHTVPQNRIRLAGGSNAIAINLADTVGDFAFPYLLIEIANWGNTNLTNVTAVWSPRVN